MNTEEIKDKFFSTDVLGKWKNSFNPKDLEKFKRLNSNSEYGLIAQEYMDMLINLVNLIRKNSSKNEKEILKLLKEDPLIAENLSKRNISKILSDLKIQYRIPKSNAFLKIKSNPYHTYTSNIRVNEGDEIVKEAIKTLLYKYSDIIIAIYGTGSYFDDTLPSDWINEDIDLLVVVRTLNPIPKYEWTNQRYERLEIEGKKVWFLFNSFDALNRGFGNRELWESQSWANYFWSIINIKYPRNAKILYGEDIRYRLPMIRSRYLTDEIFDDILVRILYRLDESYRYSRMTTSNIAEKEARMQLSKAILKFLFYLCIIKDREFRSTRIKDLALKVQNLCRDERDNIDKRILVLIKEVVVYRRSGKYNHNYYAVREVFMKYILSMMYNNAAHRPMTVEDIEDIMFKGFKPMEIIHEIFESLLYSYDFQEYFYKKEPENLYIDIESLFY